VRARDARAAEEAMDAHMRSAAGRLQVTLEQLRGLEDAKADFARVRQAP
jgi:hypothetical protein